LLIESGWQPGFYYVSISILAFYFSRWQKMLGQLLFVLPVEAATVAPGWS
jgi:hypothetical protein